MSDKMQITLLKHGVSGWNEWRMKHADIRPELANASLLGIDLVNANLAEANLTKADLRGTNLSNATLAGANLEAADFFKTILNGTDLAGANLIGARSLHCWQLESARNWQSASRDPDLACGAPIPLRDGE